MHRCLQVPEILRSIMDAVSHRESTYLRLGAEDTYAYVPAALTCKLFYEPAMACLWAVLPSLTFLMTTLPLDTWSGTPKWYHNFVRDFASKMAVTLGQTDSLGLLGPPSRARTRRVCTVLPSREAGALPVSDGQRSGIHAADRHPCSDLQRGCIKQRGSLSSSASLSRHLFRSSGRRPTISRNAILSLSQPGGVCNDLARYSAEAIASRLSC